MRFQLPQGLQVQLRSLSLVESRGEHRALARFLVLAFFLTIIGLVIVPWQQTSRGTGRVVAYSPTDRQQNIDAPVEGRLGKWFVQEGTVVREGDPIVEIFDNDPEILQRLRSERDAVQRRLVAARVAVKTSKINVDRQKSLYEQGISSRRSFEQAELEYARYLTDEANSSAELSRIEVRLARQSMQSVRAPRSGTILRRMTGQESELVKAGDVLAVLVPETESRAVELWVDGNDVPLIQESRKVRLQFEGWPAVQFSGWPSVAVGTFGGQVSFVDPADNGLGKFRVVIVPDEAPDASGRVERWPSGRVLRQGGRVNGWILLNQVSLGYELWRQFNGFPPALPENQSPEEWWSGASGKAQEKGAGKK
jgi:multidrug efflux pump subunit AcrA (membrane-fusion protein)